MPLPVTQSPHSSLTAGPSYHKLPRILFAVCILLGPLVVLLGFVFDPDFGVPHGANGIFNAYQNASALRIQLFLWFNAVTPFFFPLSYLGLALLATRRAPVLATLGAAFGLLGSLPWGLFVPMEALAGVMVQRGDSAAFAQLWNSISAQGVITFLQLSWVIGHLLGYVLLGVALGRARALPLWAVCLIVAGVPFQMIAYPTQQGIFQILGFALVFLGSIPAALALVRRPDGVAALPARAESTAAS